MRVVSLLPSATEVLCEIGGADLLVGRSHECDWPPAVADRPVLTAARTTAATSAAIDAEVRGVLEDGGDGAASLYHLDVDRLRELRPDVILTQDLCAVCSIDLATVRGAAAAMDPAPAIVSLNPATWEDVLEDHLRVGAAVGLEDRAAAAVVRLRERWWTAVDHVNPYLDGPRVVFLEWIDPLFVGGHWTPEMIEAAGGRHALNPPGARSREVSPEDVVAEQPDRVIVCPCGLDLDAIERELPTLLASRWWPALPAAADGAVALVDGSAMFNRPGPRLADAFRWLVGWLHDRPEIVPDDFPWRRLDRDVSPARGRGADPRA